MARPEKLLSAREVQTAGVGLHSDGGGLYLLVDGHGRRSWVYRYSMHGRRREMGLGSAAPTNANDARISLAAARDERDRWRAILKAGRDPINAREVAAAEARKPQAATFGQMADDYIRAHESSWRGNKHPEQWKRAMEVYAEPLRAKLPNEITTEDILSVLKPLWTSRPVIAERFRARLENVLDAARSLGHIPQDRTNVARWRGHLENLLARRKKTDRRHHPAMPYADAPAFVAKLRSIKTISARALEFTILTASRMGEVRGATWREMDFAEKVWTVPKKRMKAAREHAVPLSARALAILEEMQAVRKIMGGDDSAPIFPGRKRGKPLCASAFDPYVKHAKLGFTTHGFRSTFRDWAGEETSHAREVAEAALAHQVGDQTEAAYRRATALKRRRKLMDDWSTYLDGDHGSNVIPLRPVAETG